MFRRRNSIGGSILAMLMGLFLVVLISPLLAWQSQQQDRAKHFKKVDIVSVEQVTPGYVAVEGNVVIENGVTCPEPGDVLAMEINEAEREQCSFVEMKVEEYAYVEKEVCGELSDDQILIEHVEDDCFLVEELQWKEMQSDEEYASFAIGAYSVKTSDEAIYVDEQSFVDYSRTGSEESPQQGDLRATFSYQVLRTNMLVAGNAESGGTLTRALDGKPFVISPRGFEGTLDDLKSRDRSAATGLAIGSAIMMMLGVVLAISPLMALTNVLHAVPFIGGHVGRGIDAVLIFAGAAVGLLLWAVMFTIIVIVNNLLVAIILLAALGGVVFYFFNKSQKNKPKTIEEKE